MNGSIKIVNSDLISFANDFSDYVLKYKKWFEDYFDILKKVEENAIMSGCVHDNLIRFHLALVRVDAMPEAIASSLKKIINIYLKDLDAAQTINGVRILYGEKYPGVRDYSPSHFDKLRKMAESADYNTGFLNTVMDSLEDLYYGFLKFFGKYNNSKEKDIKNTQEAILQYNDVTKRQLRNIQRLVGMAEEKSAELIRHVTDCVNSLIDYIEIFEKTMESFSYNPANFNVLQVDFSEKYSRLVRSFNNIIKIDEITDEDVEKFVNSDFSDDYLNSHVRVVYDYIGDLSQIEISDWAFWEMLVFQMFNISEGEIATLGQYSQLIEKKELLEMMEDLSGSYSYDGSDEQEMLNEAKDGLKYFKKYGNKVYDYLNDHRLSNGKLILDGRTKEAIRFRDFLKSVENAGLILKYGDQAIDLLSTLFVEYNRNLEFLDSFEKNVELRGDLKESFEDIKRIYQHDLNQLLDDTLHVIAQDGVNALYSISIGKTVGIVKTSIGIIGDISGENAKTEARYELLTYGYDIVGASEDAFRESVRKLKEADKNSEDYAVLVADVKNCFDIYKTSLCRMFEKMAASAQGDQRDYFYYCSSHVSALTLKDFNNIKLMTYEEYLKEGYVSR